MLPKRVRRVGQPRTEQRHGRLDASLEAECEGDLGVFVRVSLEVPTNFSVGIRYRAPGVSMFPIMRVNGDHGGHTNRDDGSGFENGAHLHIPRERYMDTEVSRRSEAVHATPIRDMPLTVVAAWRILSEEANIEESSEFEEALTALHYRVAQVTMFR